jgi:hypothetical protein
MDRLHVAIVSHDQALRSEVARAFDRAPVGWDVDIYDSTPPDADVVVATPDVDVRGAVRFDPAEPERVIEDIARATRGPGCVVAVTSASRGCGVTTVALHLAGALARTARTCLVDLDSEWSASARLGADDARRYNGESGDDLIVSCIPVAGGFRVLLAPGDGPAPNRDAVDELAAHFESVVVDAPAGETFESVVPACKWIVLLIAPTATGLERARLLMSRHPGAPWVPVVNRLGPGGELGPGALSRALGRRIALELPVCAAVRDAEDRGGLANLRWTRFGHRVSLMAAALRK